jgi:hypothetical protein
VYWSIWRHYLDIWWRILARCIWRHYLDIGGVFWLGVFVPLLDIWWSILAPIISVHLPPLFGYLVYFGPPYFRNYIPH